MQHPEYVYYAAVFLIALPIGVLARNKVSCLIFAVWAIGKVAYELGAPEPQTQLAIYAIAFLLGMRISHTGPCLFATVLFAPLCLVCLATFTGTIDPVQAWWNIYWLAMLQVAALPFCLSPATYRRIGHRIIEKIRGRVMFRTLCVEIGRAHV